MRKTSYLLIAGVILVPLFINIAYAQSAQSQYDEAVQLAKEKKYDFAFLAFRSVIRNFPENKYTPEALFAIAEYFYEQKAYGEAIKNFTEYIRKYPNSAGAIFAKAYLLKIIQAIEQFPERQKAIIDNIEKEFFSKPLFLLFSEYKEVSYKSAFQNQFAIRYYVDKIEIYKNGQILFKVTQ